VLRVTNSGIGQSECTGVRFLEIVTLPDFVLGAVPFFFCFLKYAYNRTTEKGLVEGLSIKLLLDFSTLKGKVACKGEKPKVALISYCVSV
jgi:hypothetical protein